MLDSEATLVDGITEPGGLRPLPDAAELRRFVDALGSMDGLRVAELLRGKMVRGWPRQRAPTPYTLHPTPCNPGPNA